MNANQSFIHAQVAEGSETAMSEATNAAPKITGVNHLLFVCRDMNTTANFYVNILGLKLKATTRQRMGTYGGREDLPENAEALQIDRLYFFETTDGTMIAFAELPELQPSPAHSVFTPNLWPGAWVPPRAPQKLDHLSFNVSTIGELHQFKEHLIRHGVEVSRVEDRVRYVKSIYFFDPDGNPLEVATWDHASAEWNEYQEGEHFLDPDLVESLRPKLG